MESDSVLPSAESALWGSGCAICFAAQQAKRELVSSGGVCVCTLKNLNPLLTHFSKNGVTMM